MILKTKKADVRFAKIDADLLTKSRFFSRVPGGIRTPDLPLRRAAYVSSSKVFEVPRSRIKSHNFTSSSSSEYVVIPPFLLAVGGGL